MCSPGSVIVTPTSLTPALVTGFVIKGPFLGCTINHLFSLHTGTNRVECLKPEQSGRRRVLEGLQYPFAVTSYGKNLYYTDWKTYVSGGQGACPAALSLGGQALPMWPLDLTFQCPEAPAVCLGLLVVRRGGGRRVRAEGTWGVGGAVYHLMLLAGQLQVCILGLGRMSVLSPRAGLGSLGW